MRELEIDELVAGFEKEVDAAVGVDLEVVPAFGADVQIFDEVLLEDGLGAAGALDPEALGADGLLGIVDDLVVFALEPGHVLPLPASTILVQGRVCWGDCVIFCKILQITISVNNGNILRGLGWVTRVPGKAVVRLPRTIPPPCPIRPVEDGAPKNKSERIGGSGVCGVEGTDGGDRGTEFGVVLGREGLRLRARMWRTWVRDYFRAAVSGGVVGGEEFG